MSSLRQPYELVSALAFGYFVGIFTALVCVPPPPPPSPPQAAGLLLNGVHRNGVPVVANQLRNIANNVMNEQEDASDDDVLSWEDGDDGERRENDGLLDGDDAPPQPDLLPPVVAANDASAVGDGAANARDDVGPLPEGGADGNSLVHILVVAASLMGFTMLSMGPKPSESHE